MSTLFGILNKNGEPIQHEWLDRMAAKTQLPNCQPTRTWVDGCFGFGITQRYETPQDHLTAQPLNDSTSGIHIVATGRLDYRDDLARKLGFDVSQLDITADIVLMQLAWRKWQRDCALHLEGDWSMAVWDNCARTLDLLRDSVGITALHYVDNVKHFAFSTRIDALLELPWVSREPNIERLVEVLTACQGNGSATGYRVVHRMPPASRINVSCKSSFKIEEYCDPLLASSVDRHSPDYYEQFVEVFERAVEARMRSCGPVGLTLSSGFDSSSVAVASNHIAAKSGQRIVAYSATPVAQDCSVDGRLANEAPLIRESVAQLSQVDIHFSDAADVTPLQGMLEVLNACSEPSHAVVNHYWIVSLLHQARRAGVSTMLTGQLGNGTISFQGTDRRTWNDVLAGDFRSAYSRWYRQRRRRTFWKTLKSEFISPILSRWRLAYLPKYLASRWMSESLLNPSIPFPTEVKSRLIAQRKMALTDPRLLLLRSTCCQSNPFWGALSDWTGLSIRDPTADGRLIKFCLSLPDSQFQSPSEQRLLAARYLRNAGLNQIVDCKYKGLQAADILERLSSDSETWERIVAKLPQIPSFLLDVRQLREKWFKLREEGRRTLERNTDAAIWLRAIAVGTFLCRDSSR